MLITVTTPNTSNGYRVTPEASAVCPKCGRAVRTFANGRIRPHVGFINVCGVTMRKAH